jgi:hypothetical protein
VAGFVEGAEEGGREPALVEARRDAHVAWAEVYAERVYGSVLAAPFPVIAEICYHPAELFLPCLSEGAVEGCRTVTIASRGDRAYERHEALL